MPSNLPPGAIDELVQLIYQNRKLEACKRYKEMTGVDLAEAKRFIEALIVTKRAESPELFRAASSSGCLSLILFAVTVTASIVISYSIRAADLFSHEQPARCDIATKGWYLAGLDFDIQSQKLDRGDDF